MFFKIINKKNLTFKVSLTINYLIMKNFIKTTIIRLFYVSCIVLTLSSCAKEETPAFENQNLETLEVDNPVIMDGEGLNNKSSSSTTAKTTCDILGTTTPQAGNQYSFTYSSNISNPTVTWTVESGAITLISSSGNSATFQFASNFNGGSIKAYGTNGSLECSDIQSFKRVPSISCPGQSCLGISHVEGCIDFLAYLHCANNVVSVDWEYTIGPYNHVSFGSTNNPNGNYTIPQALYLPTNNWSNYDLWIYAYITLSDGSTCTISKKTVLTNCGPGGGNQ